MGIRLSSLFLLLLLQFRILLHHITTSICLKELAERIERASGGALHSTRSWGSFLTTATEQFNSPLLEISHLHAPCSHPAALYVEAPRAPTRPRKSLRRVTSPTRLTQHQAPDLHQAFTACPVVHTQLISALPTALTHCSNRHVRHFRHRRGCRRLHLTVPLPAIGLSSRFGHGCCLLPTMPIDLSAPTFLLFE